MKKKMTLLCLLAGLLLAACTPAQEAGKTTGKEQEEMKKQESGQTSREEITIDEIGSLSSYGQGEWLEGKDGKKYYRNTGTFYDAFDTVIMLTMYTDSEEDFEKYFNLAKEEFRRLHDLYDQYNAVDGVNNVNTINAMAGKEPVKVDEDLYNLIAFSKEYYEAALGKTNIAMGGVLRLWHDAREKAGYVSEGEIVQGENAQSVAESSGDLPPLPEGEIPTMEALKEAEQHTDINKVLLNDADRTVYLEDPKMSIDVGAVAKGYATQLVAERLEEAGLNYALISAGGNIKTVGAKPLDDGNWIVGIQDPVALSDYIASMPISGGYSVVTSGDYQRFFMYKGEKYHHLIDPKTLLPGRYYPSVSVITEDSGLADLLSTALFLSTREEAEEIIDNVKAIRPEADIEAVWINFDLKLETSPGLTEKLKEK